MIKHKARKLIYLQGFNLGHQKKRRAQGLPQKLSQKYFNGQFHQETSKRMF